MHHRRVGTNAYVRAILGLIGGQMEGQTKRIADARPGVVAEWQLTFAFDTDASTQTFLAGRCGNGLSLLLVLDAHEEENETGGDE